MRRVLPGGAGALGGFDSRRHPSARGIMGRDGAGKGAGKENHV